MSGVDAELERGIEVIKARVAEESTPEQKDSPREGLKSLAQR